MLEKLGADHDLAKALHMFLYGAAGKKTMRKKNIRGFSGFPDEGDDIKETKMKKLSENKKWTTAALRDLCQLLCLEKGGEKSVLVERVVDFLLSPDESSTKPPASGVKRKAAASKEGEGKKAKGATKTKKEKKADKPKKPLSAYMMFCKITRPKIISDEPGVLNHIFVGVFFVHESF
ncbi:unnamed protein product [Choristocarpus tenellus]